DVNVGARTQRVSLYALDWQNSGRSEKVEVLDGSTGQLLDTRTVSGFAGGEYLVFNVTGHVKFRVTALSGSNAVLSGIFFDSTGPALPTLTMNPPVPPPAAPPVVSQPPSLPVGQGPAGAPAAVIGQVVVTPDWIVTPYDTIPNFGGHPTITS